MKRDWGRPLTVVVILVGIGAGALVLLPGWWALSSPVEGWSEAIQHSWRNWRGPR